MTWACNLAQFGPAAFTFASDNIGAPGLYFGRSYSVPLTQLRISSLDRGFLAWFPFCSGHCLGSSCCRGCCTCCICCLGGDCLRSSSCWRGYCFVCCLSSCCSCCLGVVCLGSSCYCRRSYCWRRSNCFGRRRYRRFVSKHGLSMQWRWRLANPRYHLILH
jgi:hypothetical protein